MTAIDEGLLSPVTAGHDGAVTDAAVLDALVTAEVALVRAHAAAGLAPEAVADLVSGTLGWDDSTRLCRDHGVDVQTVVAASTAGGNPVIPLVGLLRARVPTEAQAWVHRGATSQDILDTALMIVARRALARVDEALRDIEGALAAFAREHRDLVAAARTLTQHAVPTTVGLRAATWLRGIRRARHRVHELTVPAQLGGAAGTLASFVEIATHERADGAGGSSPAQAARSLPGRFAAELGLDAPEAPWHSTRWPVTELGDALGQTIDAVGRIAADVATLSRTEIGELAEDAGGGSSAMPQKRNPAASVLIRSAALRAPQLVATLHLAAALSVDERPDGAWHAEWPTLRELLRLALGVTATAAGLVAGLRVDPAAVARNVALTDGLIVAERLSIVLGPVIGADGVAGIVAAVHRGEAVGDALRAALASAGAVDVDALLDPADYTGLADVLVDEAVAAPPAEEDA